MICNSLKECIEKTCHIQAKSEVKKRGKDKNVKNFHKKDFDVYKTPL